MVKKLSKHADDKICMQFLLSLAHPHISTLSLTPVLVLITGPSEDGIGAEIALSIASSSKPSKIILAGRTKTKIMSTILLIRQMSSSIEVV